MIRQSTVSRRSRWFISALASCIALVISAPPGFAQWEAQQQKWKTTGSLATARAGHTATLLANGKVLVVGGGVCGSGCTDFSSAELYDPLAGTWSTTGSLSVPRRGHIAVRLVDGKVLVAGGFSGTTTWDTAEIYDPDTGLWSLTGNLASARAFATGTLLDNGKVLLAGGQVRGEGSLDTAELFDPLTGSWSDTGKLTATRLFHTATMLSDGKVLVAGGIGSSAGGDELRTVAELYDPATGIWTVTGALGTPRIGHTSTMLANGKVLVSGGNNASGSIVYDTAELYDPATGQWSATGSLKSHRNSHTATLLSNGRVLAVGGFNDDPVNILESSCELFDPATETWTRTDDLSTPRANHTATLLDDDRVLVCGGRLEDSSGVAGAELFGSPAPQITGVSVSGKALFVEGRNFDEGAKLYLNDEKQKTANELGTTVLRCKKAGKKIQRGATVRLRVRNSDGTESAEFVYVRPID